MRPIYCSNFDYETRQADLQHMFSRYGEIARIDRKLGYAFVYFKDELNARDAIRHLNNAPFGNGRQRLTVEWAKGERGRHHGGTGSNPKPIKTLFVINFDPVHTRDFDIKRHFERYGKIRSVRINRNYAFARFETQEGATKALQCTHLSKIFDRVISVEYASVEDEDGRYDNDSPRGDYGRREDGASASRRSPSPAHRRIRSSPEYGRYTGPSSGPRTRSPDSVRCRRGDYGRHEYGSSRRSPSPAHRRHIRSSPDYGRYTGPSSGPRTRSPDSVRHRRGDYGRHEYDSSRRSLSPAYRRSSPEYGRYAGPSSGPSTSSTDRVRYRSRSPVRRWRN